MNVILILYQIIIMLGLLTQRLVLRYGQSQPIKRINITPFSSHINYTFLAIPHQVLTTQLQQQVQKIKSKGLLKLVDMLRANRAILKVVEGANYGYLDLQILQRGETTKGNKMLMSYSKEINQMKQRFIEARQQINALINKNNVLQWLQICLKLEILDIKIWNSLLIISTSIYEQSPINQKIFILTSIHYYLKNKYVSYTFLPSKFIYSEEYLLDLGPFKRIIKKLIICLNPAQQPADQLAITTFLIELLQKTSKINNTNFKEYVTLVKNNLKCFELIIAQKNVMTILNIYKFYSIIGLYEQKMVTQIQNIFCEKLADHQLQPQELQNFVNKLLSIWAIFNYHHPQLYKTILRPFILQNLQNETQSRFRSIWLYNIVTSGIIDNAIINQLQSQDKIDLPMSNKYNHIISHYLSILNDQKGLSIYPKCFQHPAILKNILSNRAIYSNCMSRQKQIKDKMQTHSKVYNSAEDFWLKLLQKAFAILSKKYPHAGNQIFLNCEFCVFELDAMIMLDNRFIAFQLVGNHYMLKNLENEYLMNKKHGKKILKYKIIEAYGIQILQIHSGNLIEKTISSFNSSQQGVDYLCQRITSIMNAKKI